MLFLIEYDRSQGKIVSLREYDELNRSLAESDRLQLELDLRNTGDEHEVALLDASSEQALRRTHRRYFEDLSELAKAS